MGRRPNSERQRRLIEDSPNFLERLSHEDAHSLQLESFVNSAYFRDYHGRPLDDEQQGDDFPAVGLDQEAQDAGDGAVGSPQFDAAVQVEPARDAATQTLSSADNRGRKRLPFGQLVDQQRRVRQAVGALREMAAGDANDDDGQHFAQLTAAVCRTPEFRGALADGADTSAAAVIGRNLASLMPSLPQRSPFVKELAGRVSTGLSASAAGDVLGVSKQTVLDGRGIADADMLLLSVKSCPGERHERLQRGTPEIVEQFWKDSSRESATRTRVVTRGQPAREPICYKTKDNGRLFSDFGQKHPEIRIGLTKFLELCPKFVKRGPKYVCVCPKCDTAKKDRGDLTRLENDVHSRCVSCNRKTCNAERMLDDEMQKKLAALRSRVAAYQVHRDLVDHMDAAYHNDLDNLTPDTAVIIMDFAAKMTGPMRHNSYQSDVMHPDNTFATLVIVLVTKAPGKDGQLEYAYYDFMSTDHKDNYLFVRDCWLRLVGDVARAVLSAIRKVYIWSDGGPHHFKIRRTVTFFGELMEVTNMEIIYRFFPSHHGKGPADGHTGVFKKHIRKVLRHDDRLVLQSAPELCAIIGQLKNTTAVAIDSINRVEPYLESQLPALAGMTKCHEFCYRNPALGPQFDRPGFVFGRERVGTGEWQTWPADVLSLFSKQINEQRARLARS
eukprot:TRINITY_DN3587_c0_g1_i3.p1 TRINITY_DN3587_c0_g1~~TRINITY_DN3587_c0_g1_i3.p1  ORF type:complete len:668 (-),score=186.09 TRINITY_DN3587_c0_g1_i3:264-2267(-)